MFNAILPKKIKSDENVKKDFKKLANYIIRAKGNERSTKGFAADCRVSGEYMESVIKANINCYPQIKFLETVADNSEGRVSLKELTIACGLSNYANNDLTQIRNIKVERGGIYFCNFADRGIDSEVCGHRLVLIVQNFKGNAFSSNTKILAITSRSNKARLVTHVPIGKEHGLKYDSTICCELEDTVSKRRLLSGSGVVEKVAQCSDELMLRVSVALAKADGIIGLDVPEREAINALMRLNQGTQKTYQFDNNHSYNPKRQVAFA